MEKIFVTGLVRKLQRENPNRTTVKIEEIFRPVWDCLTDTEKRTLGRKFYDQVQNGTYKNIKHNRTNGSGRAFYDILIE